jgi:hypothetical protein
MSRLNAQHFLSGGAALLLTAYGLASAAAAPAPAAAAPSPAAAAPSPAAPAPLAPMTGPQIIQVLDQTIDWYRTLGVQQQAATEPSDLLILYDNRQTANQVIDLAFEIARANAEILAKQPQPKDAGGASASAQTLTQLQNKFATQAITVQAELDSDQLQLAAARSQRKIDLQAKISELQGELALIAARRSLLDTMATFASQSDANGFSAGALKAQIDAMAVTTRAPPNAGVPPANSAGTPAAASTNSASSNTSNAAGSVSGLTGASGSAAARFGIWDLAANVVRLSE